MAAQSALDALQRIHHYPLAHFLLGRALAGMKEYERAADAYRAAISFNPNFPEAHVRLAALLEKRLGDAQSAYEHRVLARSMRIQRPPRSMFRCAIETAERATAAPGVPGKAAEMPTLDRSVIVVTGLPRSGTSMVMQMLAAGGVDVLSDGLRTADEDNPRGYLEFEPVRNLMNESGWLPEARGKAIKIVAPLVSALPPEVACRVILSERDLDEVLDSQQSMLIRRGDPLAAAPDRRRILKEEYARTLARVRLMLTDRPQTQLLILEYSLAIRDALATAEKVNAFLGGGLDMAKMAAAVDPALHRNHAHGFKNSA